MQRRESADRGTARGVALCLIAGLTTAGCLDNPGTDPPREVLNFPIASVVVPADAPRILYVANSNFDLRFNGATLQSYDLDVANQAIDTLCTPIVPPVGVDPSSPDCRGPVPPGCDPAVPTSPACTTGEPVHDDCVLVPRGSPQATLPAGRLRVCQVGPDATHSEAPLLVDEVGIGSFTDDMALSTDETRLYLAVRSDADLTRVDLDPNGLMDCGGGFGARVECTDAFRRSDRTVASERGLELPPDPVALAVGSLGEFPGRSATEGDYVVVAHRSGEVSYFLDRRTGPRVDLLDVLDGFPESISALVREPDTGLLWGPSALGGAIARVGIALDASFTMVDDSFLFDGSSVALPSLPVGNGGDLRDLVFDTRPGNDGAYVLSRSPSGLLLGRRTVEIDELLVPTFDFYDIVRVGSGPSRLELAELTTVAGPRMFAFVSCFDSRDLYVVDVDLGEVVAVSPEFSGPFEIEVDPVRQRLYVVDFRTSVIRIVDLAPMLACLDGTVTPSEVECAPTVVGILGVPDATEELE